MLIRLRVDGFKNLVGVDLPFGPFTCIAGPNAVGKSNLFDAISFLSALADRPLLDAAASIRSQSSLGGDVRRLFHHVADTYVDEMTFEADMIVPPKATDDLGQIGEAAITFLRYKLILGYNSDRSTTGGLEIRCEELSHLKRGDASFHIRFPSTRDWRDSVLSGRRFGKAFISTEHRDGTTFVEVHQDGGRGGRNREFVAHQLPRTLLSSANAAETPTALVARREMQSWRLLQLEPSALRAPDPYRAPNRIAADGRHVPSTLARLSRSKRKQRHPLDERDVYASIANTLAQVTENVRSVRVDADDRRELFTLIVTDLQGTDHEARSLSDGTLRFLALAVLAEDPEALGLICLEEPENGIHPERVAAMLSLLRGLAVDTQAPVGADNPLRQVIVNSHSPAVVTQVNPKDLVVVKTEPAAGSRPAVPVATFRWLEGTWRSELRSDRELALGDLLAYLNPAAITYDDDVGSAEDAERVIDRPDVRQLALFPANADVAP